MKVPSLMSIAEHTKSPSMDTLRRHGATGATGNIQNESFTFSKGPLLTPQRMPTIEHFKFTRVSKFYEQQKEIFQEGKYGCPSKETGLDPLSSEDTILLHRQKRNLKINNRTKMLTEKFALLRPIPKKRKKFPDVDDDEPNEEEIALEAEIAAKKKSLKFKEKTVLSYDGTKMTHLLRFHAYESILAASDGAKNISIWDIKDSSNKIQNSIQEEVFEI